jgi:hypothetical protein
MEDETLTDEERQILAGADEQAERELAAAYARALIGAARQSDVGRLADQVAARLRPGPNPYRDLVDWWRRFAGFRVGRDAGARGLALAPARSDEQADAWANMFGRSTHRASWTTGPAIQYCRALELELRRRLYNHHRATYKLTRAGWTLGTPLHAFGRHDSNANHNWTLFMALVGSSSSDPAAFEAMLKRLIDGRIRDQRNRLAHGEATTQPEAEAIRTLLIGTRSRPGVLCWLAEHLDPA